MYVYRITNLVNGKMYIGMHCGNRKDYMGSGILLQLAIQKYGVHNFNREILERCETIEELRKAEARWIKNEDAVNNYRYYNLMEGGQGGDTGFKNDTSMSKVVKEVWDTYTPEQRIARIKIMRGATQYDKSGSNNPRAKRARVNGKEYNCLKDALNDYPKVPYASLKLAAQTGIHNKKHNIKAEYLC